MARQIKLTLLKSTFGRLAAHKDCARGLGLRRRHHSVTVAATPENLGMVNKIAYMLRIEEV